MTLLIQVYLLSLFFGSLFFIGPTFLTPANVLMPCLLLLCCYYYLSERSNLLSWLLFISGIFILIIGGLFVSFGIGEDGQKDYFYLFHFNLVVLLAILSYKNKIEIDIFITIFRGLIVLFCIVLLQLGISIGVLPKYDVFIQNTIHDVIILITGGFGNPNNLSVIFLMGFLSLYLWKLNSDIIKSKFNNKLFDISIFMTFCVLIITMSRACLLVFVVVYLWVAIKDRKVLQLSFLGILLLFFVIYLNTQLDHGILTRNFDKLASVLSGEVSESENLRGNVYSHLMSNLFNYPLGLGPSNYSEAFSDFPATDVDLSTSPHTFIFEFFLAYGIFGWSFLLLIIVTSIKSSIDLKLRSAIMILLLFLLLTFIPSSMMRMPLVIFYLLLPCFIVAKDKFYPSYIKI
jgi:hypothetical protein